MALAIFILVVAFDVAGLLMDVWLWACGRETVSQMARKGPVIGALIVGLQVVGAVALACHFWGPGRV